MYSFLELIVYVIFVCVCFSYSANAKLQSKLLHDRPMKPIDSVFYWIEYVIRNRGAPHLKSVSLNVRWYQFLYLDVIGLVAMIFILLRISFVILHSKCSKLGCKQKRD